MCNLSPRPCNQDAYKRLLERVDDTKEQLRPFELNGILPAGYWRLPAGEVQPQPNSGEFVMFPSFMERGLGFPSSEFFQRSLLQYLAARLGSPLCFAIEFLRGLL
jgi:hypothetical protein